MKYTIELTNKQKAQMDCIMEIVHRYVGFNPKLEMDIPIPITVSPAYKKGFEDGKKQAIEEIPELANKENEIYNDGYNKGYNSAINDYNAMYEWLHDCFVDFEKFLLEKGFYTDEKFSDGFVVGQLMYDLICDHDMAEVISEFKKWQEEKKKAEEVENYHILVDTLRTVTEEYPKETIVSALSEFGFEVDKLRGEKDEKN